MWLQQFGSSVATLSGQWLTSTKGRWYSTLFNRNDVLICVSQKIMDDVWGKTGMASILSQTGWEFSEEPQETSENLEIQCWIFFLCYSSEIVKMLCRGDFSYCCVGFFLFYFSTFPSSFNRIIQKTSPVVWLYCLEISSSYMLRIHFKPPLLCVFLTDTVNNFEIIQGFVIASKAHLSLCLY